MIKGIGIDIVSIPRIEKKVEQLANRILSEKKKSFMKPLLQNKKNLNLLLEDLQLKRLILKQQI